MKSLKHLIGTAVVVLSATLVSTSTMAQQIDSGYYIDNGRKVWTIDPVIAQQRKEVFRGKAPDSAIKPYNIEPTARAYYFKITASDGKIFDAWVDVINYGFFDALNLRYRLEDSTGEWIFLAAPETNEKAIQQVDVENDLRSMLDILNGRIQETFQPDDNSSSLLGREYLLWLVQNSVVYSNGELRLVL